MEWLGFQLEQPPASPPAPSVLFLQLCCSFLAIFLPFRSACVCFFVSTFFFNGEPPRVRRIQGAQRGSTILFSFLFLFFTCFTTAVPGRTRNNKKNRCNPQKCGRNPLKRRLGGSWNRVVESTSLRWTSLTGRDLIVVVLRCSRSEWKASSRGSDWTLRRPIRVAAEYWGKKKQVKIRWNKRETHWKKGRRTIRSWRLAGTFHEECGRKKSATSDRRLLPFGRNGRAQDGPFLLVGTRNSSKSKKNA